MAEELFLENKPVGHLRPDANGVNIVGWHRLGSALG